jgi:ABC-type uncharacterized transport system permease subunit
MDTIYYIIAGIIVLSAIYVSVFTGILKDVVIKTPNDVPIKTYSFARTQGLWWTTIIAGCFVIAFGANHEVMVNLNSTCLTLLGIGIGTTTIGKVIDNYDLKAGFVRYQDEKNTKNFFTDILSDGMGLTVHRYQSLIFNLIFTVIFLVEFFGNRTKFPEFEPVTLGLLGISSSVYLGTKATENQAIDPTKK